MRGIVGRLWARLGRRGCFLLFLSVLDLVFAFSLFNPPAEARRSASLEFFAAIAPLWVWSLAWLIPGVLCAVQAFMRNDRLAYSAGMCIKVLWGCMYIAGAIAVHLNRAYVGAVVWLAFALVVGLISTWPEAEAPGRAKLAAAKE